MVSRDKICANRQHHTGGKIIQFVYGEDGTDPAKSASGLPVDVKGIAESVLKEEI